MQSLMHFFRIIKIARVLARYDALFLFEEWGFAPNIVGFLKAITIKQKNQDRPGKRLAAALQELGPAFIKLGQALSTRSDLLGEDVAQDLALLRDRLPTFPTEVAIEVIESELGMTLNKLFKKFDEEPVGAASIAQVHFAEDLEGNKVAVKVLRPDIEKKFNRDVELLFWLSAKLEQKLPRLQRFKLQEVIEVFAEAVRIEMDLRLEAAAATELREQLKNDQEIYIPKIYWEKTAQRVLTLERINGISIGDAKALKKSKHKPQDIVQKLSTGLFKMAFRDGFFHADMHPGNLFIDKEGRLVLIDFGITGSLSEKDRKFIAQMLHAFMNRDFTTVAEMHYEMGMVPNRDAVRAFALACRAIAEPILGLPQNEISIARLMAQLFKVAEDFKMELQPQFLMMQKAMMLAEGVSRMVYPKVNMWKLAEPIINQWAEDNLGPEAKLKEKVKEIKNLATRFNNAVKAIEDCYTPQGIRLHPDTVAAFKAGK